MGHFAALTPEICRHHTKLSTTAEFLVLTGIAAVCASTDCRSRVNGSLILLLFGYLGVTHRTNNEPSLFEIMMENGLDPNLINTVNVEIRSNGKTMEALDYIKSIYPKYTFLRNERNNLLNEIHVVSATICYC